MYLKKTFIKNKNTLFLKPLKLIIPFLLIICLLNLSGCLDTLEDELLDNDLANLAKACDGGDLSSLATADNVSDECKDALKAFLPDDQSNIRGKYIAGAKEKIGGNQYLYLLGLNSKGGQIDLESITVYADGVQLQSDTYQTDQQQGQAGTKLVLSTVLDYSGSMNDSDINDAIDIYKSIFSMKLNLESDYKIFSDSVKEKCGYTTDSSTLIDAVKKDDSFERSSTALNDALGMSLYSIKNRSMPVKFVVIATDGGENSSTKYKDIDSLYDFAKENNIHIVVLGSLLSDLDFMKAAAKKSSGYYLYAFSFDDLKDPVADLVEVLSSMVVIKIDTTHSGASSYKIHVDGSDVVF